MSDEDGPKVVDKRLFDEEGEKKKDSDEVEEIKEQKEEMKDEEQDESKGTRKKKETSVFSNLVFSLASSAYMGLGEMENPMTGQKEVNLEEAQHFIKLLNELEKKTEGNLEQQEEQILQSVLYELKMKYSQKVKEPEED